MMGNLARADIAVGYFFMSGFDAVADKTSRGWSPGLYLSTG